MSETVRITGLFLADGVDFVTRPTDHLALTFEGIPGDRHAGMLRHSGAREPWHPRGTVIRNDRQLSILGAEEMALIAAALGFEQLPAEWIGGNLTVAGLEAFSSLPPMTRLQAGNGTTLVLTAYNAPCRFSGRAIATRSGRPEHEFGFVRAAKGKRGMVAFVERPGMIRPGDELKVVRPRGPV